MIKGKLLIIGEMEVDGETLTGAFVACSRDELKTGRDLFSEDVMIVPSQQPHPELDLNMRSGEHCNALSMRKE